MSSTEEKFPWIRFVFAASRYIDDYVNDIPKSKESFKQIRWALLFLDLMFVGVVYNVDNILFQCGKDWKVYYIAFCYFIVMFNTRYQMDFYCSTYRSFSEIDPKTNTFYSIPLFQNDLWHHIVVVLYGLGLYTSSLNISQDVLSPGEIGDFGNCNFNSSYTIGFCSGFLICRVIIVLLNCVFLLAPEKEIYRDKYFIDFLSRALIVCGTSFTVVVSFFDANSLLITLPIVAFIDFITDPLVPIMVNLFNDNYRTKSHEHPQTQLHPDAKLKTFYRKIRQSNHQCYIKVDTPEFAEPNIIYCGAEEFQERLGFIFMLVLGEGVIGFSLRNYQTQSEQTWLSQVFSFLLLVSTGMLVYETVDVVQFEKKYHALLNGLLYRVPFYILHLAASILMLLTIYGMVELYVDAGNVISIELTEDDHNEEHDSNHSSHHIDVQWNSWLMAIGLCLMEVCLFLMRFLHKFSSWAGERFCTENKRREETSQPLGNNLLRLEMKLTYLLSIIVHLSIFFITKAANSRADLIIVAHSIVTMCTNFVRMIIYAKTELERKSKKIAGMNPVIQAPTDDDGDDEKGGSQKISGWDSPSSPIVQLDTYSNQGVSHNPIRLPFDVHLGEDYDTKTVIGANF